MPQLSPLTYTGCPTDDLSSLSDATTATCHINTSSNSSSSLLTTVSDGNTNVPSFSTTSTPNRKRKRKSKINKKSQGNVSEDKSRSRFHGDNEPTVYKLPKLILRIERIPKAWVSMATNSNVPYQTEQTSEQLEQQMDTHRRTSPIFHLFDSSADKSPTYQSSTDAKHSQVNEAESKSDNHSDKIWNVSRSVSRSPIYNRRSPERLDQISAIDCDTSSILMHPETSSSVVKNESTSQPYSSSTTDYLIDELSCTSCTVLLSPIMDMSRYYERALDSIESDEVHTKRRDKRMLPRITIQRHYCTSYPSNISRCIDCQSANTVNQSTHLSGCRFQYCRKLTFLGNDQYECAGFTKAKRTQSSNTESKFRTDSSSESPLSCDIAEYIIKQLGRLYCMMFIHEQTERMTQHEGNIISKRCLAGWREVCDECSTTLFNVHYLCQECGYMICIECFSEFSQLPSEKRKRFKRLCNHWRSYSLSEFIPWRDLVELRNQCIDYLYKLKIDASVRLYQSAKIESLSAFLKTLQVKRKYEARNLKKIWSPADCNYDSNIEFYCDGRLPVFNEWTSANAKTFFQKVWESSCPVIVRHVHRNLSQTLWHPDAFKEHMVDYRETPALWDCETLTPVPTTKEILAQFWDGFERLNVRLRDADHGERPRILKLKDWPTKKDFATVFPTRLHDLMKNIPFDEYTRRSYTYEGVTYCGGSLNIVEYLPAFLVKPDLGPKLYIAYSQLISEATKKAGTTNLHIDVSDAVNVLVYVGIGGHGDDGLDKTQEIQQVEAEVLNSNLDDAQLQRLKNGEQPGALWHLFRSDDAEKIRAYLRRNVRKVPGFDPIHDQATYLEQEDLERLKDWSGVESYPILQFLGDAVFIPSGAPHQVKNLHSCIKIAEDFVSPENLDRCLLTTNEFRVLSKTHTNHADILQAKNILYYAIHNSLQAVNELDENRISMNSCCSVVNNTPE